jgi:hypothetical protein
MESTMHTWTHTVTTAAAAEQVRPLYADVRRWLEWDIGLEPVTLDGPFAVGSTGRLQLEGLAAPQLGPMVTSDGAEAMDALVALAAGS